MRFARTMVWILAVASIVVGPGPAHAGLLDPDNDDDGLTDEQEDNLLGGGKTTNAASTNQPTNPLDRLLKKLPK